MQTFKEKYPKQRYLKFERLVREKVEAGYYHIPEAANSPESMYDTIVSVLGLDNETQEVFGIITLNSKLKVTGIEKIHVGTINSSIVHPRDVFKMAISKNAAMIAVFHNHPSGEVEPSYEDIQVTYRLVEAGKLLGINVIDHIIVGDEGRFTSLKDKGYME